MSDPAAAVRASFSAPDEQSPGVGFGDMIELPWLADLHVQPSSERLMPVTLKKGRTGFRPAEEHEQAAQWVSFASRATSVRRPVRAIIVSDECQIEDVLNGRPAQQEAPALSPGGRVLMAPLRPAQPEEMLMDAFKRAPVADQGEWPVPEAGFEHGGVVDFDQAFNVKLQEQDVESFTAARIGMPDDREALLRRWSAHAVRRGPLVAQTAAVQARELLTGQAAEVAGEPVPAALFGLLGLLWAGEGRIEDRISEAAERVRLAAPADRVATRSTEADQLRTDLLKALGAFNRAVEAAAVELEQFGDR